jgi:hypothetical protein
MVQIIVTFKDLQKLVQSQQLDPELNHVLERLRDRPFWVWDQQQHKQADIKTKGAVIIGLPSKNGEQKPIFDYEKLLYDAIQIVKVRRGETSDSSYGKGYLYGYIERW